MADALIPANKVISVFAPVTAEVAIWTPPAGKRFRLLGFHFAYNTVANSCTVRDGLGGPVILLVPKQALDVPIPSPPMGNGYISIAPGNSLTLQGIATQVVYGYVFGTEE